VIAPAIRILFAMYGIIGTFAGILTLLLRGEAKKHDPRNYWVWFGGLYIRRQEERVAHITFRGKATSVWGIIILLIGIIAPDVFFETLGFWGIFAPPLSLIIVGFIVYLDLEEKYEEAEENIRYSGEET
jgi:hypothetical protein